MITATLTAFSSNQLMWQHDLDNSGKLNEESQSWDLFPLNLMSMFLCVLRPALSVCPTFSPSRPEIRGLNPSANRSAAVFAYAYYTNANMRGAAQDQPSSSSSSSSPSSSPPAPSPLPPLHPPPPPRPDAGQMQLFQRENKYAAHLSQFLDPCA